MSLSPEQFHSAMCSAVEKVQILLDADHNSIHIDKGICTTGKYNRNILFGTGKTPFNLYMKSDVKANMLYFMLIDIMADNIEEMMENLSTSHGSFYLNQTRMFCQPDEWAEAIYRTLQNEIVKRFELGMELECYLIDLLSAQVYEKEKCGGGLIFVDEKEKDEKDKNCKLTIPIETAVPVYFIRNNIRQIRKLLAGAGDGYYLLFKRDENGYLCQGYCSKNLKEKSWWSVRFTGMGKWEFYHGDTPLFYIQDGEPKVFRNPVCTVLEELKEEFSWPRESDIHKKAQALLDSAMEQHHGAAIIFLNMDDEEVSKRGKGLYELQKAVCIQTIEETQEKKAVGALSRMDGAILVDAYTMMPMYAAAIVDGQVVVAGDMARGARHNSIHTFISNIVNKRDKCKGLAAAVVFSEDGGVVTIRGQKVKEQIEKHEKK